MINAFAKQQFITNKNSQGESLIRIYKAILFFVFFCAAHVSSAQSFLKGEIKDSLTNEPIIGYTVSIKNTKGEFHSGTTGDNNGKFEIEYPRLMHFILEVSHLGYNTVTLPLNKETVAPYYDLTLGTSAKQIEGLEIVASPYHYFNLSEPGEISINKNHPGMAASFDDPSRSVLRIPGSGTQNDQANTISYHGLPNEMVNWKMEGAEILNPNHLSNAGTTSNRPSASAGGVLSIPFETLDEYKFYPSPFSKSHTNAIAGISDIIPRKQIPDRLGFAKLGLLGMEAAFSKKFTQITGIQAHYRYSFTGLLGDLGIDFDGEKIRYQDLFLRFHFHDTENKGIYLTFTGGHNKNELRGSDFVRSEGYIGNIGITYFENLSEKSKIKTSVFLSASQNDGFSSLQPDTDFDPPLNSILDDTQRKLSFFTEYIYKPKKGIRQIWAVNLSAWSFDQFYEEGDSDPPPPGTFEPINIFTSADTALVYGNVSYGFEIKNNSWLIKPEFSLALTPQQNILLEPGFTLGKEAGKLYFLAGANFSNQNQNAYTYSLNEFLRRTFGNGQLKLENTRSLNSYASVRYNFSSIKKSELTLKLFNHNIFNIPIPDNEDAYFPYSGIDYMRPVKLRNEGLAFSRGIELSFDHAFSNSLHFVTNGSVFSSKYQRDGENTNYSAPNDYGFTLNAFATKKLNIGSGKLFISVAGHFRGGAYVPRVDIEATRNIRRTIYSSDFEQLSNYLRIDTRLNYTFKKKNQIILDIQNLTNRLNEGFYDYNHRMKEEFLDTQLGLIPVMSYRREF